MLVHRKIIKYLALPSLLCLAILTTESLLAEDASPSASPAVSAVATAASSPAPTASPAPTPVAPDSTATSNKGGTGNDLAWPAPSKAYTQNRMMTCEPTI